MRGFVSLLTALTLLAAAPPAMAAGTLALDFSGAPPAALKDVLIEVVEAGKKHARPVYQGTASEIEAGGVTLEKGTYRVYVEDQRTGLIVPLDNDGKGFKVKNNAETVVTVTDFGLEVERIKRKDKEERKRIGERMQKDPKVRARLTEGLPIDEGADPDVLDCAPGELLLKYSPGTTLEDRYQFLLELDAESRSKLAPLDAYRVKVDEEADLQGIIQGYTDDPRIKYMEPNMVVTIPEPVGEGE